jgi:hypothetical protein
LIENYKQFVFWNAVEYHFSMGHYCQLGAPLNVADTWTHEPNPPAIIDKSSNQANLQSCRNPRFNLKISQFCEAHAWEINDILVPSNRVTHIDHMKEQIAQLKKEIIMVDAVLVTYKGGDGVNP